ASGRAVSRGRRGFDDVVRLHAAARAGVVEQRDQAPRAGRAERRDAGGIGSPWRETLTPEDGCRDAPSPLPITAAVPGPVTTRSCAPITTRSGAFRSMIRGCCGRC